MTAAPAAADAVIVAGGIVTVHGEVVHETEDGLAELTKITHLGGPIVLFKIDVHCVVAAPWGLDVNVPKSLEVGRDTGSARAGDEQIAAELSIEGFKIMIAAGVLGIVLQLLVGGQHVSLGVGSS